MQTEEFERIVQEVYESLPDSFKVKIENLHVVVEDLPSEELARSVNAGSRYNLLGLYQGVPLNHRNTAYGTFPVIPDKVTLYQQNIESVVGTDGLLYEKIREVLIHEIGHYFWHD